MNIRLDMFPPLPRRRSRTGRRRLRRARIAARLRTPHDPRHVAANALWQKLRNRRLNGIAFERGRPIAGRLPAFSSHGRMLVIEVMPSGWRPAALAGDTFWQHRRLAYRLAGYHVLHLPADEPVASMCRRIRIVCVVGEEAANANERTGERSDE